MILIANFAGLAIAVGAIIAAKVTDDHNTPQGVLAWQLASGSDLGAAVAVTIEGATMVDVCNRFLTRTGGRRGACTLSKRFVTRTLHIFHQMYRPNMRGKVSIRETLRWPLWVPRLAARGLL